MTARRAAATNQREKEEATAKLVAVSREEALEFMEEAGFRIREDVAVAVDPRLPFMGYTMPLESGFRIVVAGGAVGSEMLNGLLIHEMSHIYRIQSGHPSHNAEILEDALNKIEKRHLRHDYQQKNHPRPLQ